MDPNETLRRIRDLVDKMDGYATGDVAYVLAAQKLAEHVEALDGWLTNGGNPPDAWVRGDVVD